MSLLVDPVPTHVEFPTGSVTVLRAGAQTTLQDVTGRAGYWDVGVPPSGAFDDLAAALGALAVGNPASAASLECVVRGPVLRFDRTATVCLTGALGGATLDGRPVRPGVVRVVPAGAVLDLGPVGGPGMRGYLSVAGGFDVPATLGSRATFLLGGFGGLDGRALRDGDLLGVGRAENLAGPLDVAPLLPVLSGNWTLRVLAGPHGAPDYLTDAGVAEFFAADWRVDHRADRTGVRLVGPLPGWARTDGGEAGLHPSNLHDSAYPVGGIMLSGDTPVVVGPDGPSLGGFVVPAVVVGADRWKLGQLRPGDAVRLEPIGPDRADELAARRRALLSDPRAALAEAFETALGRRAVRPRAAAGTRTTAAAGAPAPAPGSRPAALARRPATGSAPEFRIRRSGDRHLLVEAGPAELDLTVRMWVHLLANALRAAAPAGVTEIVEGVRSLLVAVDDSRLPLPVLAGLLTELAGDLADPATVTLQVREVTLPIAFDHPEAHEAMRRYATSVRPDAPWCPDNVEFIRRVNDLPERAEVFDVVAAATYLVIGLGDVYLGAPVAVPIDPRHRLVTTKYNPARTWTPQNAVGIGGIYLCVYGMEGPGGYQLVGRTVPVWRPPGGPSRDPQPWLLRQFDRLRFRPVSVAELAAARADIKAGRADLEVAPATFSVREAAALASANRAEIDVLQTRRRAAFAAERERWAAGPAHNHPSASEHRHGQNGLPA
ncbi:MAG TPA: 5-oxoprolinase/urea amidolyase family protein [Pseudonocardia sp.]|nr:5-oxoprolinase/urea amidolyase family protein [Pseudonocardia sp.]